CVSVQKHCDRRHLGQCGRSFGYVRSANQKTRSQHELLKASGVRSLVRESNAEGDSAEQITERKKDKGRKREKKDREKGSVEKK
ncbi:hypothetical protein PGIGA_G00079820, partial [Pangasianodon gigas]|nr:hypothetical protein [Pangasianodon gigas]